jgi:hypothetical protein
MEPKTALVVTSIASPNAALKELAIGCRQHGIEFIVIGDESSPPQFELEGCRFYGLQEQIELGLTFARQCPTRSYARKNIGYLLAMRTGASVLIETDDDNFPRAEFWTLRQRRQLARQISDTGWVNIYRYFTEARIWPRGLPLESINSAILPYDALEKNEVDCPIQQGLCDENPDVDAIYRLALPLPQSFRKDRRVALGNNSWSPFNSQNTTWWSDAFPLLYLPAYCSIRMTDIWRGFVAQRIAWTNNWSVLFHEPAVWQERNEHDLMRDFEDEVPGYLNNKEISVALGNLTLQPGLDKINDNLRLCYLEFVRMDLIGEAELDLLDAWIADIEQITNSANSKTQRTFL